jgi:hypothetical protein
MWSPFRSGNESEYDTYDDSDDSDYVPSVEDDGDSD